MAERIPTIYDQWAFSEAEELQAHTFTDLQFKMLQNETSVAAQELLKLRPTPENPMLFQCEREFIRGKLEMLEYLMTTHLSTLDALHQRLRKEAAEQAGTTVDQPAA